MIQYKDPFGGTWYAIVCAAAIVAFFIALGEGEVGFAVFAVVFAIVTGVLATWRFRARDY